MLRPYRALCLTALGVAVLIGCGKKKSDPTVPANPEPVAAVTPPQYQPEADGYAKAPTNGAPAGIGSKSGTSYGTVPAKGPAPAPTGGTVPAPVVTAPTGTAAAPATVALTQGQFDKVEAALTAAKGKVVLVDCWAVWCPPCVATFPKLVEKHEKYKDKGLVCLSVSLDAGRNTPDKVLAFLKQRNATFQNFYMTNPNDPKMDARFGQIEFIPYAVLFNKKGEKIWQGNPGGANELKVTGMIDAELAK